MKWLHFILSHSIFIAFCAVGLCCQTILLLTIYVDEWLLGFVFFATIFSYNFYWLLSKKIFGNVFYQTIFFKREQYKIIALCIYLGAALLCYLQSMLTPKLILPAILLNALYALPLLPFKWLNFTKKVGFLKTFLLAFTWMYVTAYLPLLKSFIFLNSSETVVLINRFLFMLLLCIMFDTRDIAVDKIKGLHSIATYFKPLHIKLFVGIVFLLLFSSIYLLYSLGLSAGFTISLVVSSISLLFFYYLSLKKQGYFFYYFFVDGLMLFSAMLTYVASI